MIKIKQAIIVEGKYDKIKLSSFIDAIIIEVNGFGIFKDKEKQILINNLANTCGIIIITDSDSAGNLIRNKIKDFVKKGEVYNAYIPEITGKEKRKTKPSSEGTLGVEGIDKNIIIDAINNCGIKDKYNAFYENDITNADLFNLGITGKQNSKLLKQKLLKKLKLPTNLSTNNLLKILKRQFNYKELENLVNNLKGEM